MAWSDMLMLIGQVHGRIYQATACSHNLTGPDMSSYFLVAQLCGNLKYNL